MFSLYVMVFEPKALLATHTYSPAFESETCPKSYEFVALLKDELNCTLLSNLETFKIVNNATVLFLIMELYVEPKPESNTVAPGG